MFMEVTIEKRSEYDPTNMIDQTGNLLLIETLRLEWERENKDGKNHVYNMFEDISVCVMCGNTSFQNVHTYDKCGQEFDVLRCTNCKEVDNVVPYTDYMYEIAYQSMNTAMNIEDVNDY